MENKNKRKKNVFNFQIFVSEHHQDSRALVIAALMQSVNINMKLLISNFTFLPKQLCLIFSPAPYQPPSDWPSLTKTCFE